MKLLSDIPDNKAASFLDVSGSIKYIKTTTITPKKALLINEIKEAVEEMKLIKAGKKIARNADDFLTVP